MRKLTPEERAAKKAGQAHVHTADCGHEQTAPVVEEAPVVEVTAEETPVEEKPKRGRKKAEEAVEEA